MQVAEKIRNFLTKLQGLPDVKKKIILWIIVVVLGLVMGFFWVKDAADRLSRLSQSSQGTMFPEINLRDASMPGILQNASDQNSSIVK